MAEDELGRSRAPGQPGRRILTADPSQVRDHCVALLSHRDGLAARPAAAGLVTPFATRTRGRWDTGAVALTAVSARVMTAMCG